MGYYIVWPKISKWKQGSNLNKADHYEEKGDYRRALLTLEQVVQIYPENLEARRRLARFYERLGQRQALESWKEVIRLEPTNPQNVVGLAEAALHFGDLEMTRTTLQQLRKSGQNGSDYYRLGAGLALITRNNLALEDNLAELAKLQPADLRVQLNLATVRLQHPDSSRVEAGRAALVQLAQTEPVRIRAIVELINDIALRWPKPSREREAAFRHLAVILTPAKGPRFDPPEEGDPLERLISFAMLQPAPEPEDTVALLNWMILNGRAAAAFEWIDTLPAKTRGAPPIMAAFTEAALRAGDWSHLRKLLLAGAWGVVPSEGVNHAISVRENHGRGTPAGEPGEWAMALEACHSSLPGLRMLLRLSEAWNWPDEHRLVLQTVTRNFPGETWAWRQLISYALAQGESEQLWQVYQHWSRARPGDVTVQMETAIMGLLLQKRGAPAATTTAEFVRQQPGNPAASVAHALALWRKKRLAEALSLLDSLPRTAFGEPRYALAYGVLLAEAGRPVESEPLLQRASAERLLPDEQLLIEQARTRNQLHIP